MSTRIIVHKIKYIFTLISFIVVVFMYSKCVFATQVRSLTTDPGSPVYNQEFRCAITLDQDDHRNACSLMPLNAPAGTIPWDVCTIDTVSNDKLTRFYKCIANQVKKVPGPGNYEIVDWNFTGDGEMGKVIYSRPITIQDQPPPAPTNTPKPTPTEYIPPEEPTEIIITQAPPPPQNTLPPPTPKVSTIIDFSINSPQKKSSAFIITLPRFQGITFPPGMMDEWMQRVLNPIVKLVLNFMKEANY